MTPIDTPALLTMTAERHAEIERTEWPKGRVPIVMAELLDEIAAQAALVQRLTAELARAQYTVRRDTETMAAERDAATPVNFAAIAATLKAECERQHAEVMRLTAVIRPLWDEAGKILGNPEDCDDCSALDDEGPCRVHGTSGNALYRACQAAAEVLGPCVCGHPASQHEDCDSTRCKTCKCQAFTLTHAILRRTDGDELE